MIRENKIMATKRKKEINKILIVTLIILLVVFSVLFYKNVLSSDYSKLLNQSQQNPSTNIFSSESLKFRINIPNNFEAEEKLTTVRFTKGTEEILISRVSTNFNNITDYLNDLGNKNNFMFKELVRSGDKKTTVLKTTLKFLNGQEKIEYFIYTDNWVYSLSSSSEALDSNLDQIAQSFKYLP